MNDQEYDVIELQTERRLSMVEKIQRGAIGLTCLSGMAIAAEVGFQKVMVLPYGETEANSVTIVGCVALLSLKAIQAVHSYKQRLLRDVAEAK